MWCYMLCYIHPLAPETCITRIEPVLHFLQLGNRNGFHRVLLTHYFTQAILDGIHQVVKQTLLHLGVVALDAGKNLHARYLIESSGYDIALRQVVAVLVLVVWQVIHHIEQSLVAFCSCLSV